MRKKLAEMGWQEADLAARRKGDRGKVRIARRLRQETTMTLVRSASRMQMGSWTHVPNLRRGAGG